MAEPTFNPFHLSYHTTIILVSVLPAVALFALAMGIWHCIRKRNINLRIERERKDEESTLYQKAFLAIDEQLPERTKSTAHQVPKLRIPNLPNLPPLKIDTHVREDCGLQSAPAAVSVAQQYRFGGHPMSAHTLGIAPVRHHGGIELRQIRDYKTHRTVYMR